MTLNDIKSQVNNLRNLKYLGSKIENQCLKVQGYTPKSSPSEKLEEAFVLSQLVQEIGSCQIASFDTLRDSILADFASNSDSFNSKDLKETIKNYYYLSQIFKAKDFSGSTFVTLLEQKFLENVN